MVASFVTFGVPNTKKVTREPRYFQFSLKKSRFSQAVSVEKGCRKGCLSGLHMTWPPRRTANLRNRKDSRNFSIPLSFENSSLAASELSYLPESGIVTDPKKGADYKLILVSFPDLPDKLAKKLWKIQAGTNYLEDTHLFTDLNFLLCGSEENIQNLSTIDWNLLTLFGLNPSSKLSYKTSSWMEKLTVFIADIICDFLVLDALWHINSLVDLILFCGGGFLAFIMADFVSGIYNWASRNYFANPDSCFVSLVSKSSNGSQDMYSDEEEMSDFFSNVYWYCLLAIPFLVTLSCFRDQLPLFVDSFLIFFLSLLAIWPEAHKWGHMSDPKRPPPPMVRLLQHYGLLIPIHEHLWHHDSHLFYRSGTEDTTLLKNMRGTSQTAAYCAISGYWNRFLDITGFFRKLEWLIYCLFRIEPRIWSNLPHLREDFLEMD